MNSAPTILTNLKEDLTHFQGQPVIYNGSTENYPLDLLANSLRGEIICGCRYQKRESSQTKLYTIDKNYRPTLLPDDSVDGLAPFDLYYFESFSKELFENRHEELLKRGLMLPLVPLSRLTAQKALFLDRDGVVNVDTGYVKNRTELKLIDGIEELISVAHDRGYLVIVVTNQSGIAYGYYNENDLLEIHQEIQRRLKERGTFIDEFFYCPYHPEKAQGDYGKSNVSRKPLPGMVLEAAYKHQIDLKISIMVGDKKSDILYIPYLKSYLIQGNYDLQGTTAPINQSLLEILPLL